MANMGKLRTIRNSRAYCVPLLICTALISGNLQADSQGEPGRKAKTANPLRNVYFGEAHLHSAMSADAYWMGNRMTPEHAYRFSMGLPIKQSTTGTTIDRLTSLDWVAVTDHAEYLGVFADLTDENNPLSQLEIAKQLNSKDTAEKQKAAELVLASIKSAQPIKELVSVDTIRSNWQRQVDMANRFNQPGKFTTLIAFEWSAYAKGKSLHRNIYFRGSQAPDMPFSAFDSENLEDLWSYQEAQRRAGFENFAIAHNGNIGDGPRYDSSKQNGLPMDEEYAQRKMENELLTEIMQTNGQSETHPAISPNDEFANFELFTHFKQSANKPKADYIRQALAKGLAYNDSLGANPFKFGIVAGADSHSGYSVNEEFNYSGTQGSLDDTPEKRISAKKLTTGFSANALAAPGITGVWAEENTREAIFDGLKSKETYATSGTLIKLRFFAGWDFQPDLVSDKNFIQQAYSSGVAMGGDLPPPPNRSNAPKFAVWALKDRQSGNLDRIQIIKGWHEKGVAKETIYNVALSDGREADPVSGQAPAVGNSVNVEKLRYSNDIGASELSTVWTDPDFNPTQSAVYYVRVLEIPTLRWTNYDAFRLGIELPEGQSATFQERAWSSPIWYTPSQ